MAFIKFNQLGRKDSLFVSITNSQSFGFGSDFLSKNNLLDKKYLELFFDPEEKKIGFKFTKERNDKNAFKLSEAKNTKSKSVVARSFFSTFLRDIDNENYENKYEPIKEHNPEHGDLYVIKIKKKNDL